MDLKLPLKRSSLYREDFFLDIFAKAAKTKEPAFLLEEDDRNEPEFYSNFEHFDFSWQTLPKKCIYSTGKSDGQCLEKI